MLIILISVIVGMLGSVDSFDSHWKTIFYAFEYSVTILFVIEYILRLYLPTMPSAEPHNTSRSKMPMSAKQMNMIQDSNFTANQYYVIIGQ